MADETDDPLALARAMLDSISANAVNVRLREVRFAIGGGTPAAMAVPGASYELYRGTELIFNGTTTADGVVPLLMLVGETLRLHIFDTDYMIKAGPALVNARTLAGQQKRLDLLGFVTGFGTVAAHNTQPDDGVASAATEQAILMFQCDESLPMEVIVDGPTRTRLLRRVNA